MNKTKFEAQQYLIRQAEIDLRNKTQKLLFDILKSLDEEGLNKIENYVLSVDEEYSETITSVHEYSGFYYFNLIDYFNDKKRIGIDDLSQEQQKDLIDFILKNNLVSN
jgi:hypothetical protein